MVYDIKKKYYLCSSNGQMQFMFKLFSNMSTIITIKSVDVILFKI